MKIIKFSFMKNILFHLLLIASAISVFMTGCKTEKRLDFSDDHWHISEYYGQLINQDTSYRFTFGEVLIPAEMPVISHSDMLKNFPGMEKYLIDILEKARIDSGEILFYAPLMRTMLVRLRRPMDPKRPSSITSNLSQDPPFRTYTVYDIEEEWVRPDEEIYTYLNLDKKKKQLLITDFFTYGDEHLAQIFIIQTRSKSTDKMAIPSILYSPFYAEDVNDRNLMEYWANIINGHIKLSYANYLIGKEVAKKAKSK